MNTENLTRTQISLFTQTTLASLGIKVSDRTPRSIHPYGRESAKKGAGTQPPKTRDGKTYPGGRSLRRSLAKLAMRKKMHDYKDAADEASHTMPGSMSA